MRPTCVAISASVASGPSRSLAIIQSGSPSWTVWVRLPGRAGSSAVTADDPARPGKRTHTVQLGESLWMIASDLLGPDATDAEIATQVGRIYERNGDRIGSDPNVLIAGTVLRLR